MTIPHRLLLRPIWSNCCRTYSARSKRTTRWCSRSLIRFSNSCSSHPRGKSCCTKLKWCRSYLNYSATRIPTSGCSLMPFWTTSKFTTSHGNRKLRPRDSKFIIRCTCRYQRSLIKSTLFLWLNKTCTICTSTTKRSVASMCISTHSTNSRCMKTRASTQTTSLTICIQRVWRSAFGKMTEI